MSEGIELTIEQLGMLTEEVRAPGGPGDAPHTKAFNENMVAAMRAGRGRADGELGGLQLLILTSTGRKSGQARSNPVSFFMVEGRMLILASMGGADINPAWYHNVVADPQVQVELFGQAFPARAVPTEGDDYARCFAAICEQAPIFADYQERTSRPMPVVEIVAPHVDLDAVLACDPWLEAPPHPDGEHGAAEVYRR